MNLIKSTIGMLPALLLGFVAHADVANFTAGEGYVNGALNTHADWTANPGWVVDTSGSGSASATGNNISAMYNQGVTLTGVGESIIARMEFSFANTVSVTNAQILQFHFSDTLTAGTPANWAQANLSARTDNGGELQIRYSNNSFFLDPNAVVSIFDQQGDDLAVEYSVTLGTSASNSIFSAQIINLTDSTSSDLGSYTGIDTVIYDAATTTGLYGGFKTSWDMFKTGVGEVSMDSYSVAAIPEPSVIALVGLFGSGVWAVRRFFLI